MLAVPQKSPAVRCEKERIMGKCREGEGGDGRKRRGKGREGRTAGLSRGRSEHGDAVGADCPFALDFGFYFYQTIAL